LALAIERQLQCVSPGGVSSRVARTISATFSALIVGLRPRPGRIPRNVVKPSLAKRSRQALTEVGEAATVAAI